MNNSRAGSFAYLGTIVLAASPLEVCADSCDLFAKYGIYDTRETQSDDARTLAYRHWFCQQTFSSEQDAQSLGASLGYKDLDIGYDHASQSWAQFKSSYCDDKSF